jgi:hypothetical protein
MKKATANDFSFLLRFAFALALLYASHSNITAADGTRCAAMRRNRTDSARDTITPNKPITTALRCEISSLFRNQINGNTLQTESLSQRICNLAQAWRCQIGSASAEEQKCRGIATRLHHVPAAASYHKRVTKGISGHFQ